MLWLLAKNEINNENCGLRLKTEIGHFRANTVLTVFIFLLTIFLKKLILFVYTYVFNHY
jgi:hypothetical protein